MLVNVKKKKKHPPPSKIKQYYKGAKENKILKIIIVRKMIKEFELHYG